MQQQITRDNHYVPQWYQRGFMPKGKHKLHVLNLSPSTTSLPNGQTVLKPGVEELGPKRAFVERDLYTTRLGHILNDDIETFLFGRIDKGGADAVRGWIAGDPIKMHRGFRDFFEYVDAQKLRTPKGLDWIVKHYQGLPHLELMMQMQALRQMHCTMWSECVREIVSAVDSTVKFLVSDHPVTVYHRGLPPDAAGCQYPNDPGVELVGSQTLFPLDGNHCLILTNLEYAEDPVGASLLSRRTNARFRGESMARTDALIRGRKLTEAEVHAVNLVVKSRARKYVAAGQPAWLYPEDHCSLSWQGVAEVLLPRSDLWRFGGEIYIGYKDGTSAYRDRFGRSSSAHEFLAKPPLNAEPAPDDQCGCGGGLAFRDCCADVDPQLRPSWRVMGIRERNLALIRAVNDILLSDNKTTWLDVRRNLSDDQVRRIHEAYAALWPIDTRLIDLLPSPQSKRSRALYLGMTDARTVAAKITGMLPYIDELVVAHPFVNANAVRPEFSPLHHPEQFRDQTIRNVFVLLLLEPYIREGRVHLIPDPLDYDIGFRDEILSITKKQSVQGVQLGPIDQALSEALGRDEMMRFIKRLPPDELKAYVRQSIPMGEDQPTDAELDSIADEWKKEIEEDPLALLTPPQAPGGEFKVMKSFAREGGLYVATLTGSIVYTDSDTQWARLHEPDGVRTFNPDPATELAVRSLDGLEVQVPVFIQRDAIQPPGADAVRVLLREVATALRAGAANVANVRVPDEVRQPTEEEMLIYRLRASAPLNGFKRTDVSRLVLTFGRLADVAPVRLALLLEPTTGRTNQEMLSDLGPAGVGHHASREDS